MEWRFWESRATRIARQAARWRAEMDEPESQAQVDAFEAWLAADPAHHRAYEQIDRIASAARSLSHHDAPAPAVSRLRPAFGIAALAAAAVVGAIWLAQPTSPAFAAIENKSEAVKTVTLADGSVATLDTASSIAAAVSPTVHKVRLTSGRLRLAVHLPAGQSMSVETPSGTFAASEGVLDLAIVDGGVRARLVSGQATVAGDRGGPQPAALPSDRAILVRDGGTSPAPPDEGDSWVLARIAFDNAPLQTVLDAANRRGDPKIEASDPAVADLRVTAVLDLRDTRKLARKLAAALDLRVSDRGDRLILSH